MESDRLVTLPWNYNVVSDEPPALVYIVTLNNRSLKIPAGLRYGYYVLSFIQMIRQTIDA
jgi:hypothetical protein